jgi:hypothetical protein
MVHKNIPAPQHGIAGFSTQTYGGPLEPLYSGDVPLTTDHVEVTNASATTELVFEYLSVVGYDPATKTMVMATLGDGEDIDPVAPYTVLPARVVVPVSSTITVPIYRDGYFDMNALVWDETYDTDDKKKFAFDGSVNPIKIGKKLPKNDNIVV